MLRWAMLWRGGKDGAAQARVPFGSPPPVLEAMVISRESLLKERAAFRIDRALEALNLGHLLCPDMRLRIPVQLPTDRFPFGSWELEGDRLSRRQINEAD